MCHNTSLDGYTYSVLTTEWLVQYIRSKRGVPANTCACKLACTIFPSSTYVRSHVYVCTPQESTAATHTGMAGRWHSLNGQSQLGVLRVVDHIRIHLNLPRQPIEIIRDLAFGLVIIPLILKNQTGGEKRQGEGEPNTCNIYSTKGGPQPIHST